MIMLSVMRQFKEIAFSGISPLAPECIEKEFLFDERLYLVVSEQMLKNYFPDRYPECVEEFKRGANIRKFSQMPFCRSLPNLHCMQILDHLLEKEGVTSNCVHTSGHFDLHQQMAQENLAACFSLSGMMSSIMFMCLEDCNNRFWNQPLFAPNNKIYDSYEITYKEYKDEYLPDSAIECFKKPWLW